MSAKRIFIFFLVVFLLGILSYIYPEQTGRVIEKTEYEKEQAVLIRAVDGDTIEANVNGEVWKIRMLGINCPEKGHFLYNESKNFLKKYENKTIELLRDKKDEDKYDRKLRYVFYEDKMLNIAQLEMGLANSYILEELIYKDKLLRAEAYAKEYGLGIWVLSNDTCSKCIELLELNAEEEFFILKNNCNFNCYLEEWSVKDSGRNTLDIPGMEAGEEARVNSSKAIWDDDGDYFFLRDKEEKLVIFYSY